jgi:NAD(P)-dependent dehydrogenase (short-subunit alcohol dehydrogenase family)
MRVFITGGATGIGNSLGQLFTQRGGKVGVCGFQDPSEFPHLPQGFTYYQADVTDEGGMKMAMDQFVKDHGGVDVVIANAGMNMPKTIIPDTQLGKKLTQVNVLGVINTFSVALPHFLNQKHGHFVGVSSLSGLNGLPGMSYYGASKAFVSTFCEGLAVDLVDQNIHVTCVHPGFIATALTSNNNHPMPFLLRPEEAAQRIFEAIIKRKSHLYFPFVPALFMGLLRRLPRWVYQAIMKRDLLKLRAH